MDHIVISIYYSKCASREYDNNNQQNYYIQYKMKTHIKSVNNNNKLLKISNIVNDIFFLYCILYLFHSSFRNVESAAGVFHQTSYKSVSKRCRVTLTIMSSRERLFVLSYILATLQQNDLKLKKKKLTYKISLAISIK